MKIKIVMWYFIHIKKMPYENSHTRFWYKLDKYYKKNIKLQNFRKMTLVKVVYCRTCIKICIINFNSSWDIFLMQKNSIWPRPLSFVIFLYVRIFYRNRKRSAWQCQKKSQKKTANRDQSDQMLLKSIDKNVSTILISGKRRRIRKAGLSI